MSPQGSKIPLHINDELRPSNTWLHSLHIHSVLRSRAAQSTDVNETHCDNVTLIQLICKLDDMVIHIDRRIGSAISIDRME